MYFPSSSTPSKFPPNSDILDHGEEYEKNKEKLVNKKRIITEEDDYDLIHSYNYQDTNNEGNSKRRRW